MMKFVKSKMVRFKAWQSPLPGGGIAAVALCWLVLGWLPSSLTGSLRAEEIEWLRSAEQAAEVAAQTGKPILVYFRSANCHYCDLMQANVWQDPHAADTVMRDFVPLKLTREDNPQAVEVLQIKGFPATIIFTTDRRYVDRLDGYVDAQRFKAAVAKMQAAADGR